MKIFFYFVQNVIDVINNFDILRSCDLVRCVVLLKIYMKEKRALLNILTANLTLFSHVFIFRYLYAKPFYF